MTRDEREAATNDTVDTVDTVDTGPVYQQTWRYRVLTGYLWHHPNFIKLWLGQSCSVFGSAITSLALPMTAVLYLNATSAEMGLLAAAGTAPFLLFGLLTGVLVDRIPRRQILIAADIGRGLLLGLIPLAALLKVLQIELLYFITFLASTLTAFFEVAYLSFLPTLVGREHVVEGNSKLEVSRSIAQISGPGLAGGLVSLITAPLTILVDCFSFVISALCFTLIARSDPPSRRRDHGSILHDINDGLVRVLSDPLLRALSCYAGSINLFSGLFSSIYVLYLIHDLDLSSVSIGIIFGLSTSGFLVGVLFAGRLATVLGLGRAAMISSVVGGATLALVPLVQGPWLLVAILLTTLHILSGIGGAVYLINMQSFRQAITPEDLQGRIGGTMRFITWGTLPIGGLLGGVLGEKLGLRPTLMVGGTGALLSSLIVIFSPIRLLSEHPALSNPRRATGTD